MALFGRGKLIIHFFYGLQLDTVDSFECLEVTVSKSRVTPLIQMSEKCIKKLLKLWILLVVNVAVNCK